MYKTKAKNTRGEASSRFSGQKIAVHLTTVDVQCLHQQNRHWNFSWGRIVHENNKYIKSCKGGASEVRSHSVVLNSVASGVIEDREVIIFLSSSGCWWRKEREISRAVCYCWLGRGLEIMRRKCAASWQHVIPPRFFYVTIFFVSVFANTLSPSFFIPESSLISLYYYW
jgi:hypothetical protein